MFVALMLEVFGIERRVVSDFLLLLALCPSALSFLAMGLAILWLLESHLAIELLTAY